MRGNNMKKSSGCCASIDLNFDPGMFIRVEPKGNGAEVEFETEDTYLTLVLTKTDLRRLVDIAAHSLSTGLIVTSNEKGQVRAGDIGNWKRVDHLSA